MKPKRIILVRHGESEGNLDPTLHDRKPDYALKLTEKGVSQANVAGLGLKSLIKDETIFFYVSPLWRTRMTAEQIAKHFSREQYWFREEPRLREQEWGHLRSKAETDRIEEERDAFGTFYFRFPDGESGADVYDRVSDFFGTLHRDFEKPDFPQNTLIVTHGMTIRFFLMRWFHWSVEKFEEVKNPENCEYFVLEKDEVGKYSLITELRYRQTPKHPYQRPLSM